MKLKHKIAAVAAGFGVLLATAFTAGPAQAAAVTITHATDSFSLSCQIKFTRGMDSTIHTWDVFSKTHWQKGIESGTGIIRHRVGWVTVWVATATGGGTVFAIYKTQAQVWINGVRTNVYTYTDNSASTSQKTFGPPALSGWPSIDLPMYTYTNTIVFWQEATFVAANRVPGLDSRFGQCHNTRMYSPYGIN